MDFAKPYPLGPLGISTYEHQPFTISPPVSAKILGHDNSGMLIEAKGDVSSMPGNCHGSTALSGGSMFVQDYLAVCDFRKFLPDTKVKLSILDNDIRISPF